MSTLLVHYLPRGERSRTRRLVETAREAVPPEHLTEVDLVRAPPPLLDDVLLPAYIRRNYLGETPDAREAAALAPLDRHLDLLLRADTVILAYPMFNFSVPATVKAWMDAVMQKERTWTIDDAGYRGLMNGRNALVLTTSGGQYTGGRAAWDHATPLVRHAFEFMGFEHIHVIAAEGMNSHPDQSEERLNRAAAETRHILDQWLVTETTYR